MITIGYTYYDNFKMFEHVRDYYAALDNPNIKMLFVDDGSPNRPLTPEDMPEGWSLYRITEDIGWNNEGAKNLIMKVAETEWVCLFDLDHVVFPHVFEGLHQIEKLEYNQAPFFRRLINCQSGGKVTPITDMKHKMAANSYAITKTYFWELGGYDESFQGLYGYDGSMVKQLGKLNWDRLDVGIHGFTMGGGGSSWTREQKDESQAIYRAEGKKIKNTVKERIRFPWQKLV